MNEAEAVAWCTAQYGDATTKKLDQFRTLVLAENKQQNLIAPTTCETVWSRHIVDSAQLVAHLPVGAETWFDIGSGPGFPGLVVAIVAPVKVTLVEPRARRVTFLEEVARALNLPNVIVVKSKAEAVQGRADVISARAVASIADLVAMTGHLRHAKTRMILPRGRNGASEVDLLPPKLRGMFHVEHSVTDPNSVIVIADGVKA